MQCRQRCTSLSPLPSPSLFYHREDDDSTLWLLRWMDRVSLCPFCVCWQIVPHEFPSVAIDVVASPPTPTHYGQVDALCIIMYLLQSTVQHRQVLARTRIWSISFSIVDSRSAATPHVDRAQHVTVDHPWSMVVMVREGRFHPVLPSLPPWVHWFLLFITFQGHHHFHPLFPSSDLYIALGVHWVSATYLLKSSWIYCFHYIFRLFPLGHVSTPPTFICQQARPCGAVRDLGLLSYFQNPFWLCAA